ncbi:hypothetical protein D7B24_005172 [Verticillium nonalfalfae]|uniref:Uncharacterized protein n=1 Tax=Verticillium nonalfalfae TaxID=1051616 RepID=A0A3M9YDG9_9PEZI|nr:uncharacterized protein D7B24_005172 [Verticillium nonalfalfae]RNJ58215.1 hypothetical protein D7B24_005172 [Verticillium nonalfalfae]
MAPRGNLNPRTVVAPLAAFTMACLLFTYTRSSIRTAREQALICWASHRVDKLLPILHRSSLHVNKITIK